MESKHKFPTFRSNLVAKTEERNTISYSSVQRGWMTWDNAREAGNGCNENFVFFPWAVDFI